MTTTVADAPDRSRFEIAVDGTVAGFAAYVHSGDRVVFTHTQIGDEWAGHGLGSVLAREALTALADAGVVVVPRCPFIAAYLRKHPDLPVQVEWPED